MSSFPYMVYYEGKAHVVTFVDFWCVRGLATFSIFCVLYPNHKGEYNCGAHHERCRDALTVLNLVKHLLNSHAGTPVFSPAI